MATRLVQDLVYDAPAAEVAAMLTDPAFRNEVCVSLRATAHDVRVDSGAGGTTVRIEMTQPTDQVPSFARKFVGDGATIVQTETWATPTEADVVVTIPGKPGEMAGTARLVEADGVTTETVDLQIKVRIPLVAGKIEELIAKLLGKALRAEEKAGQAWLARQH